MTCKDSFCHPPMCTKHCKKDIIVERFSVYKLSYLYSKIISNIYLHSSNQFQALIANDAMKTFSRNNVVDVSEAVRKEFQCKF